MRGDAPGGAPLYELGQALTRPFPPGSRPLSGRCAETRAAAFLLLLPPPPAAMIIYRDCISRKGGGEGGRERRAGEAAGRGLGLRRWAWWCRACAVLGGGEGHTARGWRPG